MKKADLAKRVKDMDRTMSQTAYQRVMKELAFARQNHWTLKSGNLYTAEMDN